MTRLRYAIIGCGLIGQKRAAVLAPGQLSIACDIDIARAKALSETATTDPAEAIRHRDVDVVIVATVNAALAPISRQAIAAGKHVLTEKPAGINVAEVESLIRSSTPFCPKAARRMGSAGRSGGMGSVSNLKSPVEMTVP